jgi:phosphoglycolate phosphatase-like HAD superfamily hydrolase
LSENTLNIYCFNAGSISEYKNGDVAMKAEAILFDKDGTLMDFDAFWVPVSEKAMDTVLMQLQMDRALTKSILEAIGVHNGVTDIDGRQYSITDGCVAIINAGVMHSEAHMGDADIVCFVSDFTDFTFQTVYTVPKKLPTSIKLLCRY